jgi:hypothetical protein
MTIIQVLLGEHGAIYPLLTQIEKTASSADLGELKIQASILHSVLVSHADLEDELLRPVILQYRPNLFRRRMAARRPRTIKSSAPGYRKS